MTQAECESPTFGVGGWSEARLRRSARAKAYSSGMKCNETPEIHTMIDAVPAVRRESPSLGLLWLPPFVVIMLA